MTEEKKTLEDSDIETERSLGRRSTLGLIGASVAAMAGALGLEPAIAEAQCSDSDSGPNADPGGQGRSCGGGGGCTDSDAGPNADGAGRGRNCGGGVRPRGCTDRDSGRNADPAGGGRRCGRRRRRRCTDADTGRYADGAGHGRRC